MKTIKLTLSAAIAVALSFMVCPDVSAQTDYHSIMSSVRYDLTTPSASSPQSWSFMKYGNTDVDLYRGVAQVGIPIYTYKDDDFNIPVSIGYSSGGFKPDQPTGVVGMNWSLIAGGMITREIRGMDDFTFLDVLNRGFLSTDYEGHPWYDDTHYFENNGFGFPTASFSNIYPDPGNRMYHYYKINNLHQGVETEADIFNFQFMGHSGSFHYNHKRELKVYNTGGNNGLYDIKFENYVNGVPVPRCIIITTGDGYEYTFGSATDDSYLEMTINGSMRHRYYEYSTVDVVRDSRKRTIVSWMLREIKAPNGRRVTFHYDGRMPQTEPLMLFDDSGNIIVTEPEDLISTIFDGLPNSGEPIKTGSKYYAENFESNYHSGYPDEVKNQAQPVYQLYRTYRRMSVLKSTYLTRIEVSNGPTIHFNYSLKESKEIAESEVSDIANNPFARYIRKLKKLDNVSVVYNGKTLSHTALYYRPRRSWDDETFRTMLDSVHVRGVGTYKMRYYEPQSGKYPDLSSRSIDFWGYYNGKNGNNTYAPLGVGSSYNDEIIKYDWKNPDADHSIIGNLRDIIYPTGGSTRFEYEGHRASNGVFKINKYDPYGKDQYMYSTNTSPFVPKLYELAGQVEVGGVRIKSITDDNGLGNITKMVYDYSYGSGYRPSLSSGTLLSFPRYTYCVGVEVPYGGYYYSSGTLDKTHIEYQSVREIYNDNSSIRYHYSNYSTNPDDNDQRNSGIARIGEVMYYLDVFSLVWIPGIPFLEWDDMYYIPGHITNVAEIDAIKTFFDTYNRTPNSRHLERGKLIKKDYFDSRSRPVKSEEYFYESSDSLDYTTGVSFSGFRNWYYKTFVGDYRLVGSRNTDYVYNSNSTIIVPDSLVTSTTLQYNDRGQISRIKTTLWDGRTDTKNVEYSNVAGHYNLIENMYSTVIQSDNNEEYVTSYEDMEYSPVAMSGNSLVPDYSLLKPSAYYGYTFSTPAAVVGNPAFSYVQRLQQSERTISADIVYTKYDSRFGRLLETTDKMGIVTSYIWDVNGMYVIAIVKNKGYDTVAGAIGTVSGYSLTDQQESLLRALTDVEVTTLKYIPFVGVSEIVEPSGRKLIYTYTATGKLSQIIDGEGNLVSGYEYSVEQ